MMHSGADFYPPGEWRSCAMIQKQFSFKGHYVAREIFLLYFSRACNLFRKLLTSAPFNFLPLYGCGLYIFTLANAPRAIYYVFSCEARKFQSL